MGFLSSRCTFRYTVRVTTFCILQPWPISRIHPQTADITGSLRPSIRERKWRAVSTWQGCSSPRCADSRLLIIPSSWVWIPKLNLSKLFCRLALPYGFASFCLAYCGTFVAQTIRIITTWLGPINFPNIILKNKKII